MKVAARAGRNDNVNQNDVPRVRLVGTRSNRDAVGAQSTARGANNSEASNPVRTGSSYASLSELTVTPGLGRPDVVERDFTLDIVWPGGEERTLRQFKANRQHVGAGHHALGAGSLRARRAHAGTPAGRARARAVNSQSNRTPAGL